MMHLNSYPMIKDKEKFKEMMLDTQENCPNSKYYGVYRDNIPVGGLRLHDFQMNMFGKFVKAGGLGGVAADLIHKKQGVAKDILTYFIKKYDEENASFAILYPFRTDFYRKMGFGYGSPMFEYFLIPRSIYKGETPKNLVYLDESDANDALECYNRFAERHHGLILSTEFDYKRFGKSPNARTIGVKRDGQLKGFAVFSYTDLDKGNYVYDMVLHKLIYDDIEAFREMMTFLHTQLDQAKKIVFRTQDSELYHMTDLINVGDSDVIMPLSKKFANAGAGIMYRVLNVERIWSDLKHKNFGNENCTVKFNIEDSFYKKNDKSVTVKFIEGKPKVVSDEKPDCEVSFKIEIFSSLMVGALTFKKAVLYGKADIDKEEFIPKINNIFFTDESPQCMTWF